MRRSVMSAKETPERTVTDEPAALRPQDERLLQQYLAYLRVERGLSRNTVAAYRRDITRYVRWLSSVAKAPDQVDDQTIDAWLQALRRGDDGGQPLGAASAARALAAVRGFHRFLDDEGVSQHGDPSATVSAPAQPRRLPHPLPIHEVEALIAAAGRDHGGRLSTERALRDRALVELLYGVGARISEAVGLDIDDLDLSAGSVLLRGKGSTQRVVPVGSYARTAIEAYLTRARPALAQRGRGSAALFLSTRGTRLTRQAAWTMIRQAAAEAELSEQVSPHTLRHSYATHLLHGGADVRSVQELLGHASVATTQLYTQVTVDSLREAHALAHPRARSRPEA